MKKIILVLLSAISFSASIAVAQEKKANGLSMKTGWALGLKAGTTGYGFELQKKLNDIFHMRLGGNYFGYQISQSLADAKAHVDVDLLLNSYSLLMDWYSKEVANNVRLTAGIFYNRSILKIHGVPTTVPKIGEIALTAEQIGDINLTFIGNMLQPYLGVGYGKAVPNNHFSFNFDFGFIYQGSPIVDLKATGIIAPTASEEQRAIIADNIADVYLYPVITFQLNYKLN